MIFSNSRVTSSAGISTEISRLTPSLCFASTVSVGLTFTLSAAMPRRTETGVLEPKTNPVHTPLTLSVKTKGEQRQTNAGRRERHGPRAPPCERSGLDWESGQIQILHQVSDQLISNSVLVRVLIIASAVLESRVRRRPHREAPELARTFDNVNTEYHLSFLKTPKRYLMQDFAKDVWMRLRIRESLVGILLGSIFGAFATLVFIWLARLWVALGNLPSPAW